jgi:hypothetical protein
MSALPSRTDVVITERVRPLCANKRRNDGGTKRAAASFAAMQGVPVLKA